MINQEPKHFVRDGNNQWIVTTEEEDPKKYVSESEIYFGMHKINGITTWQDILGCVIDVAVFLLTIWIVKNPAVAERIQKIVKAGIVALSTGWAFVTRELASYTVGSAVEAMFENTYVDWIPHLLSISGDLSDIADDLMQKPNYCDKIINYCANLSNFTINVHCPSGVYTMNSINQALLQ